MEKKINMYHHVVERAVPRAPVTFAWAFSSRFPGRKKKINKQILQLSRTTFYSYNERIFTEHFGNISTREFNGERDEGLFSKLKHFVRMEKRKFNFWFTCNVSFSLSLVRRIRKIIFRALSPTTVVICDRLTSTKIIGNARIVVVLFLYFRLNFNAFFFLLSKRSSDYFENHYNNNIIIIEINFWKIYLKHTHACEILFYSKRCTGFCCCFYYYYSKREWIFVKYFTGAL